jgi:hypothetical protein
MNEKTWTLREISTYLGVHKQSVKRAMYAIFPGRMTANVTTYLTTDEAKDIVRYHNSIRNPMEKAKIKSAAQLNYLSGYDKDLLAKIKIYCNENGMEMKDFFISACVNELGRKVGKVKNSNFKILRF